jgi:hypothetical protein
MLIANDGDLFHHRGIRGWRLIENGRREGFDEEGRKDEGPEGKGKITGNSKGNEGEESRRRSIGGGKVKNLATSCPNQRARTYRLIRKQKRALTAGKH